MGRTFFIGDLHQHFGHKNVLSYDNRPFKDINSHDESLIFNWNSVVDDEDEAWICGDISWYDASKTYELLSRLKGRKKLCRGNHDTKILKDKRIRDLFEEICDYKEIRLENGLGIVLCHYPIPCFKNHFYGWIHFYAHVHNSFEYLMMERVKAEMTDLYDTKCLMFNVGCMMPYMNYCPRTAEQILGSCVNTKLK